MKFRVGVQDIFQLFAVVPDGRSPPLCDFRIALLFYRKGGEEQFETTDEHRWTQIKTEQERSRDLESQPI